MKFTRSLLALSLSVALYGCATTETSQNPVMQPVKPVTKAQCRKIKSYRQGLMDGKQGKARSEFAAIVDGCREHHVKLQPKRYVQGWDVGIKQYCNSTMLYKMGKSGEEFPSMCEKKGAAAKAFAKGQKASNIKAASITPAQPVAPIQVAANPSELSDLEAQLQEILENKAQIENDLDFFREGLVHQQRKTQLQELNRRESELRAQIKSYRKTA